MMGIVLMILKVIGLLLLGILGLFVFLLLLVLFVPVPYRVWVSSALEPEPKIACQVKIFGIQVFPRKVHAGKHAEKKEKRRSKRGNSAQDEQQPMVQTADEASEPLQPQGQTEKKTENTNNKDTNKVTMKDSNKKREKPGRQKKRGKPLRQEQPQKDFRSMWNTLRSELTDEGNRRALRHVLSELRYLLRHLGPRKVKADADFSLGDPANTGYVTAALSICPFSYGKGCQIIPDFQAETMYLKGWLEVRGHVRMVHCLSSGLRLLFDKNIRKIIHKFKK